MAIGGRGQVLAPWPTRLQDGSYEFDGDSHQLPLTEPEYGNAIHGLVRWVSWGALEHEEHRVVLDHMLHPQPGYPFAVRLQLEYEVNAHGLTSRLTAVNLGDTACPYGSGAHPYLTTGTRTVDEVVLRIPAGTALLSDERGIPTGTAPVGGSELDFRSARRIGATKIDNGYTDLERDGDGLARVELTESAGRDTVTLWVDGSDPYIMVFTGDHPDVERRGLAVEPMTCAPNASAVDEVSFGSSRAPR